MSSPTGEGFLSHAGQVFLTIAFGAWAWVVKTAAWKILAGQEQVEKKVDALGQRVSNLEGRLEIDYEPKDD